MNEKDGWQVRFSVVHTWHTSNSPFKLPCIIDGGNYRNIFMFDLKIHLIFIPCSFWLCVNYPLNESDCVTFSDR